MEVRWRILLLGGLRAESTPPGGAVRAIARFPRQKTAAVLAYLAYHHPRLHLRDALIEQLWPDNDLSSGRNSLSMALSWLRRQLEPPGVPPGAVLLADRVSVGLVPDAISTDLADFAALLERAERAATRDERRECLTGAVDLYRGELLAGQYDDWILNPREWLTERYFEALRQLLAHLEQMGELKRALDYARRGVEADLLREEGHRELIRLLAAAGQPAAAQRQYRELERLLDQELNTTPTAATRALLASLGEGVSGPGTREAGGGEGVKLLYSPPHPLTPSSPHPLPTGTVTFLLTDVAGSTELWERQPRAMPAIMARHDALLTASVQHHGGIVIKTRGEGDSGFAVFTRPTQAVAAAIAFQQALATEPWPDGTSLRARAALHTGEAELSGGDYWGAAINRCARLRAIAYGGQTLISLATHELVADDLPEEVSVRSLGTHRLKDLQRPEQVFQLLHPQLPEAFPPLNSLEAFPHNLPRQLTTFIGREREIASLCELLGGIHHGGTEDTERKTRRDRQPFSVLSPPCSPCLRGEHPLEAPRLVTLVGAGGCGKTRLALQVAAEMLECYPDGVWLVELAALSDAALVPQAVAASLGVREERGRPLLEALAASLGPKSLLLILDNCEHLLPACRAFCDTLMRAAPQVCVVATSREALGLPGEVVWRVPPLSLPGPHPTLPLEQLTQYEAVRLFIERATASNPAFAVTNASAPAVAEVCTRLDGIPLAIELAAARVKLLTVEQIRLRLEDRFRLLTGGNPMALPRQQTLRATMDWSYELLTEPERALLRRLSVFAGGFTLEAAEAVCGDDVLDLLASLVDKSLVVVEEREAAARYALLETIRQYGREKLEAGETAIRDRHRDWFLALAEQAEPELTGQKQAEWLERLELEHDNLRAALAWSMEASDRCETALQASLRLGGALAPFWLRRGYLREGRERLAALLAVAPSGETLPRAKVLDGAGILANAQADLRAAREFYLESLAIRRALGDHRGTAISLNNLASVALMQGDYKSARTLFGEALALNRALGDRTWETYNLSNLAIIAQNQGDYRIARELLEASLAIQRDLGERRGIATSLLNLGNTAKLQGDQEAARRLLGEALAIHRELGNRTGEAYSLGSLGTVAHDQGDLAEATRHHEESLAIKRDLGDEHGIAMSLLNLGNLAQDQGEYAAAKARLEESLILFRNVADRRGIASALVSLGNTAWKRGEFPEAERFLEEGTTLHQELGDKQGIVVCLEGWAGLAGARGQDERAARLLGAATALREVIGAPLAPVERAGHERQISALRGRLGDEAFAAAWAQGRALTSEQAIRKAQGDGHAAPNGSETAIREGRGE